MANVDLFGYNKTKAGTFLFSSDYAMLQMNGGKLGLLQNATANYAHRVEPRWEAGSSELYWVSGQSSGNVAAGRLVGENGILEGVDFERTTSSIRKGAMAGIEFKLGSPGGSKPAVRMDGCVAQSVSIQFGAGELDVRESLSILVAKMERV